MKIPTQADIESAAADFKAQVTAMTDASAKINELDVEVLSADRQLKVSMGGQGDITGIKFQSAQYRSMAPAQLEDLLLSTIAAARAEQMAAVVDVLPESPIDGVSTSEMLRGEFNIADLIPSDIIDADFAFVRPGRTTQTRET